MSKYAPLYNYLRRKPGTELRLSFVDIERIIGQLLPKSAFRQQWWANERSPQNRHVQSAAWLDAGYEAFPQPGQELVTFRRTPTASQ